jgi:replication factor A1
LPYTSWRDIPYEKGQSVVIKKGLVREWKGKAEIVINRQSALLKSDKQFKTIQLKKERKKIGDIKTPGWVTTVGRVLSRDDREKNGKRFTRGVIGDETGRMPFTSWVDFNFREGDVVEISGMVRSWLGLLSLNIGESSEVRESQEELDSSRLRVTIGGLEDRGMAFDILVEGDLVEIQKGSGLIVRCPICRRAIKGNNCAVHGEVDGVWDLRLKGVLDDGGGNLSMIIGKDLCEALLGKKLEELKEEAKDAMDTQVVLHEMEEKLLFNRYEAIGDVRSDEFGLRMIVRSIKSAEGGDPREMAQALLGGLG